VATFLQALINGIALGGQYTLLVLGFSIIWGVMGVINFAHGEFVMLGGYMAWFASKEWGVEPLYSALPIFLIMFVVGFALQKVLVNRVIDRAHLVSLLVMFAVSIAIANAVKLIFTADIRRTQTRFDSFWAVGDVTIPRARSIVLAAALLILVALYVFLQETRLGKSIRAAAQNREAAKIVGIDIKWVYAVTFGLCIGITAVGGALTAPVIGFSPFMGPPLTLIAFVITALSGLGSIKGALGGAMALAIIQSLITAYVDGFGTNLATIVAFGMLVLILVTRPQGLFGGLRPVTPH
jgi:branched-chain amino acid transport system permease protein